MAEWIKRLCGLALAGLAAVAAAQQWTVYSPAEKDFRVVFPHPPARTDAGNGAVAFTAAAEGIEFTVYRRDPRREPLEDIVRAMQKRLQAADSDERQARRLSDEDTANDKDALKSEHVFRMGNRVSVHRLVTAGNRYYELMVRTSRENFGDARVTARDFFGSFQAGSGALVPGAAAGIAPDVLCKGRSNAFSRTFCEYRTCFQAGYEKHPYCEKLLPW